VLVQVGLFEESIRQLLVAGLKVEATALALALKGLGLLKTRAYLLDCILQHGTFGPLKDFKDASGLEALYDTCIETDGLLISLADDFDKDHVSEAICTLQMVDDKMLRNLAIAAYIQNNNLFHLLTEVGNCTLQFDNTNKTLQQFIG